MRKAFKKLWNDDRGNALIIFGASLPLLVGAAGMATDTIQWTIWKRALQRAADSGAIAGVYERNGGSTNAETITAIDHDLELNQHTGIDLYEDAVVEFPADNGDMRNQVRVSLAVQKALPFSSLFLSEGPVIRTTATAASVPGSDEYCVVSLEPSASKSGITIGGNAKIEMDCGMISNSPAANSALSNGNSSTVKASVIAAVGDVQESTRWDVDKYDPYVTAIPDPLADVTLDRSQMRCFSSGGNFPKLGTSTSNNFNGANATVTLADARAASGHSTDNCFKGLSVPSGTTMNLPAGTYYIGEGGMDIQGTLNGTDVTIVLTKDVAGTGTAVGQLNVNSSANLNLSAPTADGHPFENIAIYQDRLAGDSSQTNKINGNATNKITGAVYFPSQEIVYNGTGTNTWECTRLVGRRVTFTGTAGITNKFASKDTCGDLIGDAFEGGRRVRLIA